MPIKSAHWSYTDNGDGTTDHFLLGPDGVRSDVPVFAKDSNGNVTGLVGAGGETMPVLAGVISITLSVAQTVNSQTVTAGMAGEKILYNSVVRDDFGGMAESLVTNPGDIYVPAGVRYGRFYYSVQFAAEAASGANGIRWARLLKLPATHYGNSGGVPAVADCNSVLNVVSALAEVTEGDGFYVTAIQNCGAGLSLAANAKSNFFTAEFYK